MEERQEIVYHDRYAGRLVTESVYGEKPLRWTYETRLGRFFLEAAIRRPWFSRIYGRWADCSCSAREIGPFIERFGLDTSEFLEAPDSFRSFNEFFSRKLQPEARPIDPDPEVAVFPADGRHLYLPDLSETDRIYAKGQGFPLEEFLGSEVLSRSFAKGSALLSRLCPTDYHRYHFPLEGSPAAPLPAGGSLYSVNPLALGRRIRYLAENRRRITEVERSPVGSYLFVEVGATNVGSIVETHPAGEAARKGAEKGYFRFGGSMVVTIFPPETIDPDPDLLEHSSEGVELYARMGDRFGQVRSTTR